VADLPLGKSQVILEYTDQGKVTFSDSAKLRVGLLDVRLGKTITNRVDGNVESVMRLSSKGPLSGLDIDADVTISEMIWDAKARGYLEKVSSQERISLARGLIISGNEETVEHPIRVPLPSTSGLWKLTIDPTFSPDIMVANSVKPLYFNSYPAPSMEPGEPYTIAVFPDTQYLSESEPVILNRMTQWLLEKADTENIMLALHVGDIVNRNIIYQWENAQQSISQLNGLVPYAMAIGNHDMAPGNHVGVVEKRQQSMFAQYFPREFFSGLQGSFPVGRLDNTYHTLHINGNDYLVVSLEFAPPDEVLAWANQVVDSFPNHKVIVLTHEYLGSNGRLMPQGISAKPDVGQDPATTWNDGQGIWDNFARYHANIFLIVCGHNDGVGLPWHVSKGVEGNSVIELLIDWQDHNSGWLALLEFTPNNKMGISVYSPYLDTYKQDVSKYGYTNRFQIDLETKAVNYKY
jgi:hypothetical protein